MVENPLKRLPIDSMIRLLTTSMCHRGQHRDDGPQVPI